MKRRKGQKVATLDEELILSGVVKKSTEREKNKKRTGQPSSGIKPTTNTNTNTGSQGQEASVNSQLPSFHSTQLGA
jgi:hypothetical protein